MSPKLPKHRDLDADLWPGLNDSPLNLFFKLGCLASGLIALASWLGLLGMMTAGWLPWAGWPYVVLPIGLWLIFLGLPALWTARRGALAILDAITVTAEAWLARAGYSIDLNNDGYIGHVKPVVIEPPQTQITQPVIYRSAQGTKLLTKTVDLTDPLAAAAAPTETQEADGPPGADPTNEPLTRYLWELPNKVTCPQETVAAFVDGVFTQGWSRSDWVPKRLDRETYDGLIALLEQAKLLEGRKPGYKGKLAVNSPRHARMVLGLPKTDAAPPGAPAPPAAQEANQKPATGKGLVGRYEHI